MKSFFIAILVTYLIIVALMFIYQRNFMYFPGGDHPPVSTLGIEKPILIKPDVTTSLDCAERIETGWYWPPKLEGAPVIVFFHGNGQAYQYWMNKLNIFKEKGYGAAYIEYPGYGGHHGRPTEKCIYRDSLKSISWLQESQGILPSDMVFYGESLGSGVAVEIATHVPDIKALILESPFSSAVDIGQSKYWFLPVSILMQDRYENIKKIGRLKMPKLFVHGHLDRVIPISSGKKLYEAAPEPKKFVIIEEAGHNDLFDHNAGLQIMNFLSKIAPIENNQRTQAE